MRPVLIVVALGLTLLLSPLAGRAASTGFYLRGSVGGTDLDADIRGYRLDTIADDDSGIAYGLSAGWRFLPWLAVEAGYHDLGHFNLNCEATPGLVCAASYTEPFRLDGFEAGLAAHVPFGDSRYYGLIRAGAHEWDLARRYGTGVDPYYGGGIGYGISQRWCLSLEFERYRTEGLDVDRIGVSVEFML